MSWGISNCASKPSRRTYTYIIYIQEQGAGEGVVLVHDWDASTSMHVLKKRRGHGPQRGDCLSQWNWLRLSGLHLDLVEKVAGCSTTAND